MVFNVKLSPVSIKLFSFKPKKKTSNIFGLKQWWVLRFWPKKNSVAALFLCQKMVVLALF
jgi:hypothetical protein